MSQYDFNVNNYSYGELVEFLNIPYNSTADSIKSHIKDLISKYNIADSTNEAEKKMFVFLKQTEQKLLQHIKDNTPIQLKQANYDVIHSKSLTEGADHNVTVQKTIPIVNTNEYKYPVGVINPVEKRVITKVINLDTAFKHNSNAVKMSASNILWELPNPLNNVISMKIAALELPSSWYTISAANNSNNFTIKLFNMTSYPDSTYFIEIPDGNYTAGSFATAINTYFKNKGVGLNFLQVNIDPINSKTVIRARDKSDTINSPAPYNPADPFYSPNFYFTLTFNTPNIANEVGYSTDQYFNPLQKRLGWYMGFRNSTYTIKNTNVYTDTISYSSGSVTYYGYLSSEAYFANSSQNYVFLEVNDFNKNVVTDSVSSLTNGGYIGNNILGRITVPMGSDKIFKTREYFGPVKIKRLNIRLLNKFGDVIDLNNNDFSLALEFNLIY